MQQEIVATIRVVFPGVLCGRIEGYRGAVPVRFAHVCWSIDKGRARCYMQDQRYVTLFKNSLLASVTALTRTT